MIESLNELFKPLETHPSYILDLKKKAGNELRINLSLYIRSIAQLHSFDYKSKACSNYENFLFQFQIIPLDVLSFW